MIVLKFGGKSLDNIEKVKDICEYIKERALTQQVVVVVSAFGDDTNQLIEKSRKYVSISNKRELDIILSTGEMQSASIVASVLCSIGAPAKSYMGFQLPIYAMGDYGHGVITSICVQKIKEYLNNGQIAVVAGFQAINKDGDIITLGRGGSDTTAVALGAVLCCEVEIYSDYDGIFAGDPRRLPYKKYKSIDYAMMQKYASEGAKVLSESSVEVARSTKTNIICKSSTNKNNHGTVVCKLPNSFIGVSVTDNISKLSVVYNTNIELQKIAKYILESVNYYEIFIKNNNINIFLDSVNCKQVEKDIANLLNLLEE